MKLERLRENFAEGIVETNRYRIGNIFYYLKSKRSFVTIHFSDEKFNGRILRVEDDHIKIVFPEFQEGIERRGTLTFEALNRYYYTEILLLSVERDVVSIQTPVELKHLIRRLYPRIVFDDLFMRFINIYSPIFSSKAEERHLENRFPFFFQEVRNDAPSLRVLHQMIISEIRNITREFSLVMVRDRDPKSYTLLEKMVLLKKRAVLIENTQKIESYFKELGERQVSNYHDYFTSISKKKGSQAAEDEFERIQKVDLKNFKQSYFAAPILIFDRPVGYLYMETNIFDKYSISHLAAQELRRLLEVFSYAITKIRISSSHYNSAKIATKVVNISISGLLMEIDDHELYRYLQTNRRIKIMLPVMGEELEIYGEIIRFFEKDGYQYLGVLFFKTRPGDMQKLEEYLYENIHYQFF